MTFTPAVLPGITPVVVPARWFGPGPRRGPVELVVIHDTESAEVPGGARAVARYFAALPATRPASAHFIVDRDEIVQCVQLADIAWAAPGANANGIQVELVGRAGQGTKGWGDPYSVGMLARAADLVAHLLDLYTLPTVFVGPQGLKRGLKGVTGHAWVNQAFHKSSHTDPGPTFPWSQFARMVRAGRAA